MILVSSPWLFLASDVSFSSGKHLGISKASLQMGLVR